MAFDMKDYVEVSDRIRAWYETHPEGAIRTEILEHTDARVTVRAEVYRNVVSHAGAPAGVGHSSLAIPGKTPYTKESEVENAETSAVGRALVMAGIPAKHVASETEIKSKKGSTRTPPDTSQARREDPVANAPAGSSHVPADEGGNAAGNRAQSNVDAPAPADATIGEGGAKAGAVPAAIDTSQDMADLLIAAVKKAGTLANVVKRAHKLDPTVRTEADLLGWHLIEITEGKG